MPHEPRLNQALRELLLGVRVAALGTLDREGLPAVSMVPFAVDAASAQLVLQVSALAAHTQYLQTQRQVSLLIAQPEQPRQPVHALPRVTVQADVMLLIPSDATYGSARSAYVQRFPDAEAMMSFGDFMLVALQPTSARHVAGFGAARTVDARTLRLLLAQAA